MLLKTLLLGVCLLAAVVATSAAADDSSTSPAQSPLGTDLVHFIKDEWAKFKLRHKRTYTSLLEAGKRFAIFADNVRTVLHHNRLFSAGNATFDQKINLFADMTTTEVSRQRNGFNVSAFEGLASSNPFVDPVRSHRVARAAGDEPPPAAIDWVRWGAVSAVLDQGDCGSCWTFAVSGAIEAWHWRLTGQLIPLSQQQLLDCTPARGNKGCQGGNTEAAYAYVRANGGLAAAAEYPYRTAQGSCRAARSVATVQSVAKVPKGDEQQLMLAVAKYGPVAIAIDSSNRSFHFYRGGIYQEPLCYTGQTDHAVLLVGYGTDAKTGLDYWLVKNSWGADWGENGYVRILRNARNNANCCMACYAVYPTS